MVNSVLGFFCQDMDRDIYVYLQTIFKAVGDRMACFRSLTSNILAAHSARLFHDVSPILTLLDCYLTALASEPLVTTSSYTSGPGEPLPPS